MVRNAFVTGPTGAVGTAIIRLLLEKGARVTALVRPDSPLKANLPESPNLSVLEGDLRDLDPMRESVLTGSSASSAETSALSSASSEDPALSSASSEDPAPFDVFFHLGWSGTYGESRNDRVRQQENVRFTLDAVRLADALGCSVFVFAGSQSEFGPVDGPVTPETPCAPDNAYGEAKLDAETVAYELCRQLGIRFQACRIFSTYGPCDKEYTMVMSTLRKMISGERLSFTKGEQLWNYLYNDDTARAFVAAAEKGRDGQIYLIASDHSDLLKNYITKMRDIAAPDAELHFGEIPYYDHQIMHMEPDISALVNDTGFRPEVSFEEGIRKTVEWLKR